MSGRKILFIRDHQAFIDLLEERDYNVVLLQAGGRAIARQVVLEDPDLIVLIADGLDCDAIDPLSSVPESHRDRVLAVSGVLHRDEFLAWVERRLSYIM